VLAQRGILSARSDSFNQCEVVTVSGIGISVLAIDFSAFGGNLIGCVSSNRNLPWLLRMNENRWLDVPDSSEPDYKLRRHFQRGRHEHQSYTCLTPFPYTRNPVSANQSKMD